MIWYIARLSTHIPRLMVFECMFVSKWFKLDNILWDDVEPSVDVVLKVYKVVFDPDTFKQYNDCIDIESQSSQYDMLEFNYLVESPNDIVDGQDKISKVNANMRQFTSLLLKVFHKDDHKIIQTLKNHHNLHYDNNVYQFGSVPNYNGGCNEENMKSHVTNPSQLTQRQRVAS